MNAVTIANPLFNKGNGNFCTDEVAFKYFSPWEISSRYGHGHNSDGTDGCNTADLLSHAHRKYIRNIQRPVMNELSRLLQALVYTFFFQPLLFQTFFFHLS